MEKELLKRDMKNAQSIDIKKEEERPVNQEPIKWEAVKEDDFFRLEELGETNMMETVDTVTEWKRTFKDPLADVVMLIVS